MGASCQHWRSALEQGAGAQGSARRCTKRTFSSPGSSLSERFTSYVHVLAGACKSSGLLLGLLQTGAAESRYRGATPGKENQ